jgi:phosphoglycerate kinase
VSFLSEVEVKGKVVLVRVDFNVPLRGNPPEITDDSRIRAALPTITSLIDSGACVVLVAHLGRPKGEAVEELRMAPVAERLGHLLKISIPVAATAQQAYELIGDGARVVLLENIRFDRRETSKIDEERVALATELARGADLFVSDGFGVVHRKQASVSDVAEILPSYAGLLVAKEVEIFTALLDEPERPYVVILGGAKVADKLGVIGNLINRVDTLLIGGGMAYTFLAAQGNFVGDSLLDSDHIVEVQGFLEQAKAQGVKIHLPVDVVVADSFAADARVQVVPSDAIPEGWQGLDIGPLTRQNFADAISQAKTVVWNGPMGVFEFPAFSHGTRAVAQALVESDALSVIGGGDSAAAMKKLDLPTERITHISTGGGASLEFLEGKSLPGLAVLGMESA